MNVIITGASRGIGFETAALLSKEHRVLSISRSAGKSRQPGITAIDFDFETGNIAEALLPEIRKSFGRVDVLINNAAAFLKKPFEELTREDFAKLYQVNVFSVAELTRAVLPLMAGAATDASRGHVLNIASMGGVQGSVKFPGLAAYSSGKGALITLTECLAEEFRDRNISFNAIAFGSVQTEMLTSAFPGFKAPVTAREAAEFVAYFAVNGQHNFNGKTLQMARSTP